MDNAEPQPGVAETLARGVTRILAPNPSPMTLHGTNTYLLGDRAMAVIDPGPLDEAHLAAILGQTGPGRRISHIFVTHAHADHSPLAAPLAAATGARIHAFGGPEAGRSAIMRQLAASGGVGGGEGVDAGFRPDVELSDGQIVAGDGWRLTAHWTPGHFGNHLCFSAGDMVFTGDLVMGWASSLVSPPDGDLTDFMASCRRLKGLNARVFHAGHGAPVDDPAGRLDWLIGHRLSREAAILEALTRGPGDAASIAAELYTDTPALLMPAATRNVLAHLIDLMKQNLVSPYGDLTAASRFFRR